MTELIRFAEEKVSRDYLSRLLFVVRFIELLVLVPIDKSSATVTLGIEVDHTTPSLQLYTNHIGYNLISKRKRERCYTKCKSERREEQ